MSTIATLPFVSSEGGLSRYLVLVEIRKFPLLSASEEVSYARRWREHGDREAAYRLVTSHLRLAAKIAMKYRRYGLLKRWTSWRVSCMFRASESGRSSNVPFSE